MTEGILLKQILLHVSKLGARLFRNNVGLSWSGKIFKPNSEIKVSVGPRDVVIYNARPIHMGLCEGSSDLIGWTPVKITEAMVGKTVAVFTAIEAKTINVRTTAGQKNFIETVNKFGGLAGIVHSTEEVEDIINGKWEA